MFLLDPERDFRVAEGTGGQSLSQRGGVGARCSRREPVSFGDGFPRTGVCHFAR